MGLASPEVARKREAIVRAHVDAENRHDIPAVVSTFHQPKYEVMPLGAVLDGAQPFQRFSTRRFRWLSRFRRSRAIVRPRRPRNHRGGPFYGHAQA